MHLNTISFLIITIISNACTAPILPDYTGHLRSLTGASPGLSILASLQTPIEHVYSSRSFSYHISPGPSYPGGLVARSLWWILTDARRHPMNATVPSEYHSKYHSLPAFHLEISYGTFSYADMIDLCESMRIVTRQMNGGRLPAYGGAGSRWQGRIYRTDSRIMPDGYFYFDQE